VHAPKDSCMANAGCDTEAREVSVCITKYVRMSLEKVRGLVGRHNKLSAALSNYCLIYMLHAFTLT